MALVLSAAQMRAVDRAAVETLGVPGLALMENAGRGVADVVVRALPAVSGLDVRIVCGAGQNGGDGFVVARHLANRGARVTVLLALPRAKIAGDAAVYARVVEAMVGISVRDGAAETDPAVWRSWLAGAAVIVDAVFGTGLKADVTGAPAAAIRAINDTPALRVAIDLPSGLDADSGAARGDVVKADLTATMGCRKLGLVLDPEAPVGRVEVVDIGVSVEALADAARAVGPLVTWLDDQSIRPLIPRRRPGSHKGTGGHVLLIAGSPGHTGAALLSARASLRAGAGLATIASTQAGQAALDAKVIAEMTASYSQSDDPDGDSYDRVLALAGRMKAAAIGPGIPTGAGARALVERVVAELPLPLVVDADALTLLGQALPAIAARAPAPRVLTPHPGEMARIAESSTAEVQADRLGVARRIADASRAVVVLKGARTVVAAPGGGAHVNPTANPALATAGSGDVLTGVVTALLAQGLGAEDAARAGVFLHGAAADAAAQALGSGHLIATDLPEGVARALAWAEVGLAERRPTRGGSGTLPGSPT